MTLNTTQLTQCVNTLERSLELLGKANKESLEYEVFRNATIKGFELPLETTGKLLRKTLKTYFTIPKEVDDLIFKEVLRHSNKHGLLTTEEVKRWFKYRDNRNNTAHDYGLGFAKHTLTLLPEFLTDVRNLAQKL
jgi:Nucleotidyltransferase substrate binding protein like